MGLYHVLSAAQLPPVGETTNILVFGLTASGRRFHGLPGPKATVKLRNKNRSTKLSILRFLFQVEFLL